MNDNEKCTSCQVDIPLAFRSDIVEVDIECHENKKKKKKKSSIICWTNPYIYIILVLILWLFLR
jgi:hypothetical protein